MRREQPAERRRAAFAVTVALILLVAWVLGGGPGGGGGRGGAPEASATALVTGAGGSLSREPMAAGPGEDCEGCAGAPEQDVVVAPTETPEPTATPEPTPTPEPSPTPSPYQPSFAVPARAVAILEAPCGALLYGKEPHTEMAPASLTKIVTALALIDRVNLGDTVEVQISARELKSRTRSSVMGLEPGMRVTVKDLLYGLFLPSGNDAAIVLAQHVSGSVEAFSGLMNEAAANLGMNESTFSNPHGLDSDGLRSSAHDMAVAGMEMMRNQTLAAISSASSYTLEGGLTLTNGNRLLRSYPGAYGVKIGRTRAAGDTIVAAAERDGRHLYAAVFDSDDLYNETSQLLDWAFAETPRAC